MEFDQPDGPYDMNEYGHTTVEDDLQDFPMSPFVGRQILSVREIRYQDGNLDFAVGITDGSIPTEHSIRPASSR